MRQIQASKNSEQIQMFAVTSGYLKKNIRYGHTQKNFYDVAEKLLRISASDICHNFERCTPKSSPIILCQRIFHHTILSYVALLWTLDASGQRFDRTM